MGSIVPLNLARIVMLMHTMTKLRDAAEKSCKLNAAQTRVLCYFDLHEDQIQMGKLAESLRFSASVATKTIASLEISGYVNRVDNKTDRRGVYVSFTEKGRQTAARLWQEQQKIITSDYHLILDIQRQNNRSDIKTPYTGIYEGIVSGDKHSIFTLTEHYVDSSQILSHHARLHDISLNAYFILLILHINGSGSNEVTPSDLATFLLVKKKVISHALSELISKTYIDCSRSRLDRRKNVLDLTSEGYALIAAIAPALCEDLKKISFPEPSEEDTARLDSSADCFAKAMRKSFHP